MMLICSTDLKPTLGGFFERQGTVRERESRPRAGWMIRVEFENVYFEEGWA